MVSSLALIKMNVLYCIHVVCTTMTDDIALIYLSTLLQCCIDDDFDMVQKLVKLGATVDIQDNEGWTPLHAAASCGHDHIVR